MYHNRSCKRLHELVWHNYETKGRGDLLSRPKIETPSCG